jgi:hypothetical protein
LSYAGQGDRQWPRQVLFDVPATAREVTPSERILGPLKECKECDAHTRQRFQKLDEENRRFAVKPQ